MLKFTSVPTELTNQISQLTYTQLFVLCDENTYDFCYPLIQVTLPQHHVIVIPAGEENKTLETCAHVWQTLLESNADRHSLLLNLGGGVVTDLGGFVASTYKRGISFINLPTSYLAMVDASVGGKTGIDFCGVKNSIGVFQEPEMVLIDTQFLATLPKREFNSGKAEVIKHGLIADNTHFHSFLQSGDELEEVEFILKRSVAIKQDVVKQDQRETGLRKILNFGHTIGHAIEAYSLANEENYLLHGEAIAIGMIVESYLSLEYAELKQVDFELIDRSIRQYFEIRTYTKEACAEMICYLQNDKKNKGGKLLFTLLNEPGEAIFDVCVSEEDCLNALIAICGKN